MLYHYLGKMGPGNDLSASQGLHLSQIQVNPLFPQECNDTVGALIPAGPEGLA